MSFPGLQAFQYANVAAILPHHNHMIENTAKQAKANIKKWSTINSQGITNYWPIAIAAGAIFCLAGVFLTLAAHQVLPHGINAISDLGIWGQIAGYGGLGIGFIIALIGAVKWYLNKQNTSVDNSEPDVSCTLYNAEVSEMDSYFPQRLKDNELFAVDDPSRKEIKIYYREWDNEVGGMLPAAPEIIEYKNSTPNEAFERWSQNHATIVQGKTFINLDTLRQRTESFEKRKVKTNKPENVATNKPENVVTNQDNVKDTTTTDTVSVGSKNVHNLKKMPLIKVV